MAVTVRSSPGTACKRASIEASGTRRASSRMGSRLAVKPSPSRISLQSISPAGSVGSRPSSRAARAASRVSPRRKSLLPEVSRSRDGDVFGAAGAADAVPIPSRELGSRQVTQGTELSHGHDGAVLPLGLTAVVMGDEVQDDAVVSGIEVVVMIGPAAGAVVDFDAAGAQLAAGEKDQGVAKVRAEAVCPGAAVHDLDRLTRDRLQRCGRPRMPRGAEGNLSDFGCLRHRNPIRRQPSVAQTRRLRER